MLIFLEKEFWVKLVLIPNFFSESTEVKDAIVILILKMKNILNEQERGGERKRTDRILPDNVPTPMTRTSQMASSVMTGPCMDIPWAMFLWTSSWVLEFRANRAMAQALDRSISSRKNGSASLKIKEKIKITHCLKWAHQSLCPLRRKLAPYFNFMVLNKVVKYFKIFILEFIVTTCNLLTAMK